MATKKTTTKKTRGAKKTTPKASSIQPRAKTFGKQADRDPRLPAVGSVLTREFKGKTIEVKVTEDGFEFDGQMFRSISGVARHITGYGISGPVFFRLTDQTEAK